jgi:hypothetical protein
MAVRRRWLLAVLAGALLAGAGCDLGSLMYFLMPAAREPAKLKQLASEDGKTEPHVAILTYAGLETRAEFIGADRQLTDLLARHLRALAEENKEKLHVIPLNKVENYKNTHPNWKSQDLAEVGRDLGADYVVYLEINGLELYEQGSGREMFHGHANLTLNLVSVKDPDETFPQQPINCRYPSAARGPEFNDLDTNPVQFRMRFLDHVARELSLYFTHYPKRVGAIPD